MPFGGRALRRGSPQYCPKRSPPLTCSASASGLMTISGAPWCVLPPLVCSVQGMQTRAQWKVAMLCTTFRAYMLACIHRCQWRVMREQDQGVA